jgi:hypothetical protein
MSADLVLTTPAADGIVTLRLIRQAAADHGLALSDHSSLGTPDQIADTLDNLGLLLRQVEEHTFPDPLDADPRTGHDHWLEYGFADQLRNAPPATADAVYDSYQSAYRELQTRRHRPTRHHVRAVNLLALAPETLAPGAEHLCRPVTDAHLHRVDNNTVEQLSGDRVVSVRPGAQLTPSGKGVPRTLIATRRASCPLKP